MNILKTIDYFKCVICKVCDFYLHKVVFKKDTRKIGIFRVFVSITEIEFIIKNQPQRNSKAKLFYWYIFQTFKEEITAILNFSIR